MESRYQQRLGLKKMVACTVSMKEPFGRMPLVKWKSARTSPDGWASAAEPRPSPSGRSAASSPEVSEAPPDGSAVMYSSESAQSSPGVPSLAHSSVTSTKEMRPELSDHELKPRCMAALSSRHVTKGTKKKSSWKPPMSASQSSGSQFHVMPPPRPRWEPGSCGNVHK